jgi:all-trans-retinol 13,14-reductase
VAYDVVVIGAGISGLVDAVLLAETGRRVLVLEQHTIPGGYLQQFRRKRTVFDVGFHYMGSTQPGRPMRQLLEHLRVWHRIRMLPFPDDAAIEVRRGERSFAYPTRFERFHEKAVATWPHARDAVDRIVRDVDEVCSRFKWFDLRRGRSYGHPLDMKLSPESFRNYVSGVTDDAWLREVLAFQTFNLGLFADEIPWVKYALAFRSNFDLTTRIDGGGGALVDALVARGKELGVEYRFRSEVESFACEGRVLRSVATANGDRFAADLFVAACPPKVVLRKIPDEAVHPKYKARVFRLKDSRGALQVFLRLTEPLRSLGDTCLLLHDEKEASHPELPLPTILVTHPTGESVERGGPRLEAMTYMYQEPFARWRDRPVLRRGAEYEGFKQGLARRMVGMIARVAPELPDLIEDTYVATPLSDEWYTRNTGGGVFGISHDVTQQGTNRPLPRLRLKNLWFTGHSITMPGICGVFVNAFDTCGAIRGDEALFDAVAT